MKKEKSFILNNLPKRLPMLTKNTNLPPEFLQQLLAGKFFYPSDLLLLNDKTESKFCTVFLIPDKKF
jgi:hypothetical protein